jgi:hypothetical protein
MCVVLLALALAVGTVLGWGAGRRATRREVAELVAMAALITSDKRDR